MWNRSLLSLRPSHHSRHFCMNKICWESWVLQSVFVVEARKQHFAWQALSSLPLEKLDLRGLRGPPGTGDALAQARSLGLRSERFLWIALVGSTRLWRTRASKTCSFSSVRLVMSVLRPRGFAILIGGIFQHFPQIFGRFFTNLLHGGFSRHLEAQHDSHPSLPPWESDWRCRCWGLSPAILNFFQISHFCTSQALANAVHNNTTLTDLGLQNNQIRDKGVEARVFQFSISFRFPHFAHRRL